MTADAAMPDFRLDGRVALVTGAGRGLGEAIALRLAAAGAAVGVNDLEYAAAARVAVEIERTGGRAIALAGDVADAKAVETMFSALDDALGTIAILVNNAGVADKTDITSMDLARWNRVVAVNLTGPVLCTRAALARMYRGSIAGRVIMLGSLAGHQGALRGWPGYGATKAGLHGLAKTLARSAAPHRVTVNVVAPGVIRTDLLHDSHGVRGVAELASAVPIGRLGEATEVAAAVQFLASDAAAYITGAVLDVNGGLYMRA